MLCKIVCFIVTLIHLPQSFCITFYISICNLKASTAICTYVLYYALPPLRIVRLSFWHKGSRFRSVMSTLQYKQVMSTLQYKQVMSTLQYKHTLEHPQKGQSQGLLISNFYYCCISGAGLQPLKIIFNSLIISVKTL